jgi:hypothetical protein
VAPRSRDSKLGKWADKQRAHFKTGKMDKERIRMFDEIGFDFAPYKGEKRRGVIRRNLSTNEVDE